MNNLENILKKRICFFVLIIVLLQLIISCTSYEEIAPFFDGLFLEYAGNGKPYLTYKVNVVEDYKFKIIETDKLYTTERGKVELFVDSYGKVYESREKRYIGRFSPIWIPVHEMKIGDTFDKRNFVERNEKWERWDVLVVKDTPTGAESYYDINTGYWVGGIGRTSAGSSKLILINTNADIPTIEP